MSLSKAQLIIMTARNIACSKYDEQWDISPSFAHLLNKTNMPEINQYFYHPDHASTGLSTGLGSASFVTDATGYAEQHIQYLPFGELFISQRNSTFDSRYKFTAKELDNETQYTYFGARYLDSEVSIWLSIDPLSDKYPSMSAYMYCAGNPVILVDPDGRYVSCAKSGQRGKIGTFLSVQWDVLTNQNFRKEHRQRRRDRENNFVYMDVASVSYTRPKNATESDAYTPASENTINKKEVKFNTRTESYRTSNKNRHVSNNQCFEDRIIDLPNKMNQTSIIINLKFDIKAIPDRIQIISPLNDEVLFDTNIDVHKGSINIKTNSQKIGNQIKVKIYNTDNQPTDFDYRIIVKPKIGRDYE